MATMEPREARIRDGRSLTIRTAEERDADHTRAIALEVTEEGTTSVSETDELRPDREAEESWIQAHRDADRDLLLVAEVEDRVVGLLNLKSGRLRRLRHRVTLGMTVKSSWRGQRVGQALLQTALDWARDEPGIDKVALGVLEDNTPAIALYRKLGFVEEGRRPKEIKRGPDSWVADILMYQFV